jgi:hypothetical protein
MEISIKEKASLCLIRDITSHGKFWKTDSGNIVYLSEDKAIWFYTDGDIKVFDRKDSIIFSHWVVPFIGTITINV